MMANATPRNEFTVTFGQGTSFEQKFTFAFETDKDGNNPAILVEHRSDQDFMGNSEKMQSARVTFDAAGRSTSNNWNLINNLPPLASAAYSGLSVGVITAYNTMKQRLDAGVATVSEADYSTDTVIFAKQPSYSDATVQPGNQQWRVQPMVSSRPTQFKVRASGNNGQIIEAQLNDQAQYVYNSPTGTSTIPNYVNNLVQGMVSGQRLVVAELKKHYAAKAVDEVSVEPAPQARTAFGAGSKTTHVSIITPQNLSGPYTPHVQKVFQASHASVVKTLAASFAERVTERRSEAREDELAL